MNQAESINQALYRNIKSGQQYAHLMPYSNCSSTKLTTGDTKAAIDNMAIWSKKYQNHTKNIAVTFAGKSTKETAISIHSFLYHHFQYKIDGLNQELRSPACSWASRQNGIDCKSYSIFASTILLNLGIHHFLRRIKQSATAGYSHVYVIVPKNQKNPKNLKLGYYTIDGTLAGIKEPDFYQKSDVFMSAKINNYGLAGQQQPPRVPESPKSGGGGGNWQTELVKQIFTTLKPLLDEYVKLLVRGFIFLSDALFGCDVQGYNLAIIKVRIEKDFKALLIHKLELLDEAILFDNKPRIQHILNDIFKELDLGIAHLRSETSYLSDDDCVGKTLTVTLNYMEKIKQAFEAVFTNFIKSYSKYEFFILHKTATTDQRTMYFVVPNTQAPISAEYRFIILRKNKSKYGIEPILPYGEGDETFEGTSNKWLSENTAYLRNNYSDGRENRYRIEVKPLIDKVGRLRYKAFIGGEGLYLFEQPIQREMYKIWLKYDTKYTDFLKKEAQSLRTANELAVLDFQKRLSTEISKDKSIKNKRSLKKKVGIGLAVAAAGLLIVKV
ncbi:hypothetical protein F7644_09620 [Tenacibaculum finnmarkense genomovar ulcerans]|uniref:hypothetical protein n=1 Tax=Tenacibaculum finnmarkense TaxID=2781243 RepID=UPI00187B7702|nr:hypothetical protein [Tenacibaculum finnmarkense]MBE7646245.1 hypothetical protein [Tenacibaculum finnmarkense genomovar ulcerans]